MARRSRHEAESDPSLLDRAPSSKSIPGLSDALTDAFKVWPRHDSAPDYFGDRRMLDFSEIDPDATFWTAWQRVQSIINAAHGAPKVKSSPAAAAAAEAERQRRVEAARAAAECAPAVEVGSNYAGNPITGLPRPYIAAFELIAKGTSDAEIGRQLGKVWISMKGVTRALFALGAVGSGVRPPDKFLLSTRRSLNILNRDPSPDSIWQLMRELGPAVTQHEEALRQWRKRPDTWVQIYRNAMAAARETSTKMTAA